MKHSKLAVGLLSLFLISNAAQASEVKQKLCQGHSHNEAHNETSNKFGNNFEYDWEKTNYAVSSAAKNFSSKLTLTNYTLASSRSKVLKAEQLLLKVIRSPEFKKAVLEYTYRLKGKKYAGFSTTSLTRQQVYEKIIAGAESYLKQDNNRMDLTLTLYTDNDSNTVGYTYPNKKTVYVNTKFFYDNEPVYVAQNMMHEWLHKIGFDHDFEETLRRPYSVPYAVGRLIGSVYNKL
jgi:hypothetical protein